MTDRLKLYRALSKRLLRELALQIDMFYEDEDIGFLAEEDPTFRMFRKGVRMFQEDGKRLPASTLEVAARIERCHAEYFETALTLPKDEEL